jgi:hypothetical protein
MTTAILLLAGSLAVVLGMVGGAFAGRLRNRHEHGPWIIVGTRYTPPADEVNARGYSSRELADVIYGYTTLTERCGSDDCRMVRTRLLRGHVADDVSGVTIR